MIKKIAFFALCLITQISYTMDSPALPQTKSVSQSDEKTGMQGNVSATTNIEIEELYKIAIKFEATGQPAVAHAIRMQALHLLFHKTAAIDPKLSLMHQAHEYETCGKFSDAIAIYEHLAKEGYTLAETRLGILYKAANNWELARVWFLRAANKQEPEAQFNLGLYQALVNNSDLAKQWYQIAANNGSPYARNNLGLMLEEEGQIEQALQEYLKAARHGHKDAQYNAARICQQLKLFDQAIVWYEAAAKAGDLDSQNNLASLLENKQDYDNAEMWYYKAATAGLVHAQVNLAELYATRGAPHRALYWYQIAAKNGDSDASTLTQTLSHRYAHTIYAQYEPRLYKKREYTPYK